MRLSLLLFLVPLGLLALAMLGLLAPALRWTFRVCVAAVLTLAAFLILPLEQGTAWLPMAIFAGIVLLLWVTGRRSSPAVPLRQTNERSVAPAPLLDLGPAWWTLRELADWRTRRRLDAAANACARYMAIADDQEDPSAQLPIKIRKHLPEIVADCVRHSQTATPDERRALLADTLATLEQVAGRAEERRRALAYDAQRAFRARQPHLAREED